jgi:hypothetical protein
VVVVFHDRHLDRPRETVTGAIEPGDGAEQAEDQILQNEEAGTGQPEARATGVAHQLRR